MYGWTKIVNLIFHRKGINRYWCLFLVPVLDVIDIGLTLDQDLILHVIADVIAPDRGPDHDPLNEEAGKAKSRNRKAGKVKSRNRTVFCLCQIDIVVRTSYGIIKVLWNKKVTESGQQLTSYGIIKVLWNILEQEGNRIWSAVNCSSKCLVFCISEITGKLISEITEINPFFIS